MISDDDDDGDDDNGDDGDDDDNNGDDDSVLVNHPFHLVRQPDFILEFPLPHNYPFQIIIMVLLILHPKFAQTPPLSAQL